MSTKSIIFNLMPLTDKKINELNLISNNFKLIYNTIINRFAGVQDIRQMKMRSILNKWRKELSPIIICHSKIAEESIEFARANYQTIRTTNENTNPELKTNIIRIHNSVWKFKKYNGTYYIEIPTLKIGSRYKKVLLPIKDSDYYDNIINNNKKFGVGQLDVNKNVFITSIHVDDNKNDYSPESFIGVDLGKNNLAVIVILGKKYEFINSKFWNGKKNKHIRNSFDNYRKDVSKIHREDLTIDSKHYEHNWMKNVNHNISREIIEIVEKQEKSIIVLEDLHRFAKFKWNFYQLRQMIEYKAKIKGIKTILIPPAYTSQKCPKCSNINKLNRSGVHFKCLKCNYKNNADFVGAYNIACNAIDNYK